MRPVEFLYGIWSRVCKPGDYIFLSVKEPRWQDYHFKFDNTLKGRVRDFLRQNDPSKKDIYFCPLPFSEPQRIIKNVKPVNILWADIDDGNAKKFLPNVLWESSPGRQQAIWFIDRTMPGEDAADINRALTYYLGADKGGWDLTQVLRIPGTFNHKYKSLPKVKLKRWDKKTIPLTTLTKVIRYKNDPIKIDETLESASILKKHKVPRKVLEILDSEPIKGERSDTIWYLENKLHEAGLSPEETIQVIKDSPWNKYRGRNDEDVRIRSELGKIVEKKIVRRKQVEDDFKLETFSQVMSNIKSSPGWQIPGFWMKRSHGIIAGEPKSFKSTLAMDMSLSVATGKPFLGRYPIESQGKVLYIQNENTHWIMKDRFEKMVLNKGLQGKVKIIRDGIRVTWPEDIPFFMLNQQSFMLDDEDHQDYLENLIQKIRPELIVFDPLYLMFDGEISSAQDLFPILQWLLHIKNEYNCGVIVVHHYNKSGEGKRGGQRMLGSTTLHGWVESAWYITSTTSDEDGKGEVIVEREFRGAGIHNKLQIEIAMGDIGNSDYSIEVSEYSPESGKVASPGKVDKDIKELLESKDGITEDFIQKNTGLKVNLVRECIDRLIHLKFCYRDKGKVYLK